MSKVLDLNKPVFELAEKYPDFIEIFAGLGFSDIKKPAMLNSMGRIITIRKGSEMKGIPLDKIKEVFREHGYDILGDGDDKKDSKDSIEDDNANLLKQYLIRLSKGESLESVQKEFRENFESVDASEIMKAEQSLMESGVPYHEVQKLCDIHSALFHGATSNEVNGEEIEYGDSKDVSKLIETKGHPLATFTAENKKLEKYLNEFLEDVKKQDIDRELFAKIREVSLHYAKKGDLLYPLLKTKYNVSGPSSVMWSVDDEIRDELGRLAKVEKEDEKWFEDIKAVITRMQEMIYKEENILFPICAKNFSDEDWINIYIDSKGYENCLDIIPESFDRAKRIRREFDDIDGEIVLPGGHFTKEQLIALLDTMPLEITFVDENDINRFFNDNDSPKAFKRPLMAIDRDVFSCHPPKIEPMVREIISGFKDGSRDEVSIWMKKNNKDMLVRYMAVRDKNRKYLGTMEIVQDMDFARKHFEEEDKE
jgi:hemerythrin HHE cation binding domain protein